MTLTKSNINRKENIDQQAAELIEKTRNQSESLKKLMLEIKKKKNSMNTKNKNIMKKTTIILGALFMILNLSVYSQGGVVISNGAATADPSAMLDVQSDTKGMLVPRMTTTQRTAISSPATGLLVFDTTTGSFWFYNGSTWEDLSSVTNKIADADNDTKVQVEKTADDDIIRFDLAGTEHWKMTGSRLEAMNNGNSVFIGEGAGAADDLNDRRNVFIGKQAGNANTEGKFNTAIGYFALKATTEGFQNTATGSYALANNISSDNSAYGINTLLNNTTGYYNTACGAQSLYTNTTGIHNTGIGYATDVTSGDLNNVTAIGYYTKVTASNTIRLGNIIVNSIGGHVGWTTVSDGRFKTNLKENVAGLDFIMKLRPLTYHFDMDAIAGFNKTPDNLRDAEGEKLQAETVQVGFVAQEVEEAAIELGFDFHGVDAPKNEDSHYGLRYAEFVVPLVKAVQEQQAIIENQQDLLSKYESTLEEMNNRVNMLEAKVSDQHSEKYVAIK